EDCGIEAMRERWLRFITDAFITQSRFDPMHSAESEQLLLEQLDDCLHLARQQTQVDSQLVYQGGSYEASVAAPDLIAAVSGRYQMIADATRALSGAGLPIVLQISDALNALPGFKDYVCARSNANAIVLDESAASKGALNRYEEIAASGGQRLCKQLQLDGASLSPVKESGASSAEQPSHLLFGHQAIAIGRESLLIGAGDEHLQISLPTGSSGVSKRHCSLQLDGNSCVLSDHSRYGTFLNGKRVNGSAVLQAGDRLRVGTPGHEFLLIRVGD
ncbi:MAG: FHA domain-containing protein, partial [Pseudomonadota bacterium]